MFKNLKKNNTTSGMTLVELMVVLAIFLIVTGLTIFDYRGFKSKLTTQNLADDVALSIRKAQSFATGTRGSDGAFDFGYGIHFSMANNADKKTIIIFIDRNGNKKYDAGSVIGNCGEGSTECVEVLYINTLDEIKGIYSNAYYSTGQELDIVFKRPNPDADFCFKQNSSSGCDPTVFNSYSIIVGPTGQTENNKSIRVTNTGQISIENSQVSL